MLFLAGPKSEMPPALKVEQPCPDNFVELLMKPLEPPDRHYAHAAAGWLGLGAVEEAEAELQRIALRHRNHPDVLQVRWQCYAQREQWTQCLDLAKRLTQLAPERRFGWIHLAFSLHRLNRPDEAREILLYALDLFEPNATMALYLGRCCCRLGHLDEARQWLAKAFELVQHPDERHRLKQKALTEPDLEPLRAEIAEFDYGA